MRLLRFDVDKRIIDLHPFVTVVKSLTPQERADVLVGVKALGRGSTAGIRGLVQNQGLLVELRGFGDDRVSAGTAASVVVDCGAIDGDKGSEMQAEIERQRRRAEVDAVLVEEVRAEFHPAVKAKVAELLKRLAPIDQDGRRLRQEFSHAATQGLASLAAIDRTIREAPPGLVALTGRVRSHNQRQQEAQAHVEGLAQAIAAADEALRVANKHLVDAEAAAKPIFLTKEEEHRLESLSFPELDESRRGRNRKKISPEEEAELQGLLAKVGVDSWTAYTMHRSAPSVAPERHAAVAQAKAEVAAAGQAVETSRQASANDPVNADLTAEGEAIREEARHYLGIWLPADLEAGLQELVVEIPNPEWEQAAKQLGTLLVRVDQYVQPETTGDEIVEHIQQWLRAEDEVEEEIDVDALNAELAEMQILLARHERSLARIDRAEASAAASRALTYRLEEQMAIRVDGGPRNAAALLGLVEPMAEQIESEGQGSLPIAIVSEFDGFETREISIVLDRLSELSEVVQVIVVSDNEVASSWASGAGLERALLSKPKSTVVDTSQSVMS